MRITELEPAQGQNEILALYLKHFGLSIGGQSADQAVTKNISLRSAHPTMFQVYP